MYLNLSLPLGNTLPLSSVLVQIPNIISDKKDCTLTRMVTGLPKSEYEINPTQINHIDALSMYTLTKKSATTIVRGFVKVPKTFNFYPNYIVDTTYPLYKNFRCYRDSYIGSYSTTKYVQHVEINLYHFIPELIYCITGNYSKYNDALFKALYSDIEYIRMCDIMTAFVNGFYSENEIEELNKYFQRDSILSGFLSTLRSYSQYKKPLTVRSFTSNGDVTIIPVSALSNPFKVFGYYISSLLSNFLPALVTAIKNNSQVIHLRSLSDFRFILEVDKDVILNIEFLFKVISLPEIKVKPKIYYNFERLQLLNYKGVVCN